jgi:predicted transcriptional regulator
MAKLGMGELEAAAMDVLWDQGGWRTAGEVHEVLSADRELAYTTVLTILVRLHTKGRVDRHRDGRAYAYRPVLTREEYAADRMGAALQRSHDRPAVLSRFLQRLTPADRAQLRRMLKSHPEG